jgi:hypothetical protein
MRGQRARIWPTIRATSSRPHRLTRRCWSAGAWRPAADGRRTRTAADSRSSRNSPERSGPVRFRAAGRRWHRGQGRSGAAAPYLLIVVGQVLVPQRDPEQPLRHRSVAPRSSARASDVASPPVERGLDPTALNRRKPEQALGYTVSASGSSSVPAQVFGRFRAPMHLPRVRIRAKLRFRPPSPTPSSIASCATPSASSSKATPCASASTLGHGARLRGSNSHSPRAPPGQPRWRARAGGRGHSVMRWTTGTSCTPFDPTARTSNPCNRRGKPSVPAGFVGTVAASIGPSGRLQQDSAAVFIGIRTHRVPGSSRTIPRITGDSCLITSAVGICRLAPLALPLRATGLSIGLCNMLIDVVLPLLRGLSRGGSPKTNNPHMTISPNIKMIRRYSFDLPV